MARLPLLENRDQLDEAQQAVFDGIVASRGSIIRPYQVLLHAPEIAGAAADLGHQIRFEGRLSDHDRELAILASARQHRCPFEWESHLRLAEAAGVRSEVIDSLLGGTGELTSHEALVVGFVRELCTTSTLSEGTYAAAVDGLGTNVVVELAALVGYYTMLGYVMNMAGAGD